MLFLIEFFTLQLLTSYMYFIEIYLDTFWDFAGFDLESRKEIRKDKNQVFKRKTLLINNYLDIRRIKVARLSIASSFNA